MKRGHVDGIVTALSTALPLGTEAQNQGPRPAWWPGLPAPVSSQGQLGTQAEQLEGRKECPFCPRGGKSWDFPELPSSLQGLTMGLGTGTKVFLLLSKRSTSLQF